MVDLERELEGRSIRGRREEYTGEERERGNKEKRKDRRQTRGIKGRKGRNEEWIKHKKKESLLLC